MNRYIYRWIVAGLVVCGLLAAIVHEIKLSRIRVDQSVCDQIRKGMTEKEVEAIIGVPAGNYTGLFIKHESTIPIHVVGSSSRRKWEGKGGTILVFFDENETVVTSMYFPPSW